MIVDTHVHIISPDQRKYPRHLAPHAVNWVRDMPVDAESLLQHNREAGIDRTVIVQAVGAYEFDNSYAADAVAAHRDRFTLVCCVDARLAHAPKHLEHWVRKRGARGVRLFTSTDPEGAWLDDPATFPLWERARDLRIPVTVQVLGRQLHKLRAPVERFPDIPVAVDHMGAPGFDDGPPFDKARAMWDLARCPNVYLKLSTMSIYAAGKGASTPALLFPRVVEAFGARRLMWGSNFPNTYDRSLKDQLALARETFSFLSEEEREWLFGETALTFWPELQG